MSRRKVKAMTYPMFNYCVRLTEDMVEGLDKSAKKNGRTFSQEVRARLEESLAKTKS